MIYPPHNHHKMKTFSKLLLLGPINVQKKILNWTLLKIYIFTSIREGEGTCHLPFEWCRNRDER
ncbi:hypothetical protein CWO92_04600 [Heyndrickxia camelliae]|uniref:Uncharacterized protein n=1 Tax=Heyndrickxia camelliae TaxID=1707093 RepID=A0A2N3LP39_9BACI|nr:hypothetical protein CWO92_04600 [Heyndrickxia camelliae]